MAPKPKLLMSSGSKKKEVRYACLSEARASHSHKMWAEVSSPTPMFWGSVKSNGYPHHLPVSPSLLLPCITMCHHISTGLCLCHDDWFACPHGTNCLQEDWSETHCLWYKSMMCCLKTTKSPRVPDCIWICWLIQAWIVEYNPCATCGIPVILLWQAKGLI